MEITPSDGGPLNEYLGIHVTAASGERVEARWTADERHHQPFGLVHGGVHASVVESLGSIGASIWYGARGRCVGVNNNTDFFRGVSTGAMTSVALPVHQGRSQQVWVVETHDEQGRLVARGQLRVQNLATD